MKPISCHGFVLNPFFDRWLSTRIFRILLIEGEWFFSRRIQPWVQRLLHSILDTSFRHFPLKHFFVGTSLDFRWASGNSILKGEERKENLRNRSIRIRNLIKFFCHFFNVQFFSLKVINSQFFPPTHKNMTAKLFFVCFCSRLYLIAS